MTTNRLLTPGRFSLHDWPGRTRPARGWLGAWVWALAAAALLYGITLTALLALGGYTQGAGIDTELVQQAWFWRILRFTLGQALLSAALSVILALPVARALALDTRLPARALFLRWSLLCFVMPSLVLITGLVAVFGRSGWLTPWLGETWSLYGLNGILLAHVFMNMPLAVRVLTQRWQAIPANQWKLAAQLGVTGWRHLLLVEWPAIRAVLPGLAGFIFLLCFNSFAVVLALGGGPAATTLEVAMYQALKFNFDPAEALALAWVQLLVAGGLYFLFSRGGRLQWLGTARLDTDWQPQPGIPALWLGRLAWLGAVLFLTLPILTLLPMAWHQGSQRFPWHQLLTVSLHSLILASAAATLALGLALGLLNLWRRTETRLLRSLLELTALQHLILPGMVISVGLYIGFMPHINWLEWGWVAVIGLNALVALPFVVHQIRPRWFDFEANYRRLSRDLGLHGWRLGWYVLWPWLSPAIRRAWALSFVIALGDFAVFGVFGNDDWQTLPWLIYALAGSYRLQAAALASLLLLALALIALWWLEEPHAER